MCVFFEFLNFFSVKKLNLEIFFPLGSGSALGSPSGSGSDLGSTLGFPSGSTLGSSFRFGEPERISNFF